MIRVRETGMVVSAQEFKRAHPNVAFPADITQDIADAFGGDVVVPTAKPTTASFFERVVPVVPVQVNGVWKQAWRVESRPDVQVAKQQFTDAIVERAQDRLDSFARTRGYDGILSACTYVASPVPRFKSDAEYCVGARDATWLFLYDYLERVSAGTTPTPMSYGDIEPMLPQLVWPA